MNRKFVTIMTVLLYGSFTWMSLTPVYPIYVSAQSDLKEENMHDPTSIPGEDTIEEQLIRVARERVNILANQVAEKRNEITLKQDEQSKFLRLLNKINELDRSFPANSSLKTPISSIVAELKEDIIRSAASLDESDYELKKSLIKIRMKQDVDQIVAPLQTKLNVYTTELEQDWNEFQSLNDKLREAIEILNNLLQKYKKS